MIQELFLLENGTSVVIREATFNDAVFLNEMVARVFATTDQVLTSPEEFVNTVTLNAQLKRIENYNKAPGKLLLVAMVDGKLVGTLDFWNGNRKRIQHSGEFGMGLLKEFRNLGIGQLLISVLIQWARENPIIEKIKLGVFASNEIGIHVYQKMGFKIEGRSVSEIKMADGQYCDVIEMYLFV